MQMVQSDCLSYSYTISHYSSPLNPRKIPGWIVVVGENLSVNKRVCSKKQQLKLYEGGFVCFPIQIFHLAFTAFISQNAKFSGEQ